MPGLKGGLRGKGKQRIITNQMHSRVRKQQLTNIFYENSNTLCSWPNNENLLKHHRVNKGKNHVLEEQTVPFEYPTVRCNFQESQRTSMIKSIMYTWNQARKQSGCNKIIMWKKGVRDIYIMNNKDQNLTCLDE